MRHAEHSAASWQISILAYWHISNLLTMQHYKALFTLGIPIVIGKTQNDDTYLADNDRDT